MNFDFVLKKYLLQVCLVIYSIVPWWELDGYKRSDLYRMRRKELEYTIEWFFLNYLEKDIPDAMREFKYMLREVIEK